MPTLTADDAMRSRLVKAARPPIRPAAQHAADKPPKPQPVAQQKPVVVQQKPVEVDPETLAQRRAQLERRNVLWAQLREVVLLTQKSAIGAGSLRCA
jgi:hypothetical protein